jgi:flavin-dependent dehydrogenase
MIDVLVVGAGPAGAVAATVLARAGAHVRMVDRASFPRHKLCGDTINPGAFNLLRRLRMVEAIEARGLRLAGMTVTGPRGVRVRATYPREARGFALSRHDLDAALVECAVAAGVCFDDSVGVRGAVVSDTNGDQRVSGVDCVSPHAIERMCARVVIAADGRHSTLAFGMGLARHPAQPRRWAVGAYAGDVDELRPMGEMHIREDRYIGIAPLPDGLANVCVVGTAARLAPIVRGGRSALLEAVGTDPALERRLRRARLVTTPAILGPLAVDRADRQPPPGLLLAGDAAGFVDPMTGDGLRFAVRGGELAALAALDALSHGWSGVQARLAASRAREFAGKWRFNRVLRRLVASAAGVRTGAAAARVAPAIVRSLILHASDWRIA